jgi:hypothetical protein
LLEQEQLDPRSSYRTDAEQIDGSFIYPGQPFLLEAKWHAERLPASSIYAFKGKVDGKLAGTLGLMISMNGFSEEAVNALALGKEINVLLADRADLEAAVSAGGSFTGMLAAKIRAAVDSGAVYVAYEPREGALPQRSGPDNVVFVVEGPRDALIVESLARRLLANAGAAVSLSTRAALGIRNLPPLAAFVRDTLGPEALVGAVVDADERDPQEFQLQLGMDPAIRGRQIPVIAASPTLEEEWLGATRGELRDAKAINALLDDVDLEALAASSPSFARFREVLLLQAQAVLTA